jgi:hypothetical protein
MSEESLLDLNLDRRRRAVGHLERYRGHLQPHRPGISVIGRSPQSKSKTYRHLVAPANGRQLYSDGGFRLSAARCASVDPNNCGSNASVQTSALNHYHGRSLGGSNPFTSSATGCGHTVTASYSYSLVVPLVGTYAVPLSTSACFP